MERDISPLAKPGSFDEDFLDAAPRRYASDRVFEEIGAQILRGEAAPGTVLPAEKDLSAMFGVSKLIVRQAVHRLASAGFVTAHQGGRTLVRDPWESATMEAIALFYRIAPDAIADDPILRSVLEKQYLQGLALVEAFARRASKQHKKELLSFVEAQVVKSADDLEALEAAFWTKVAEGTGNRVLAAEVRFWYALASRPKMPSSDGRASISERAMFYTALATQLRSDDDALGFYIKALAPLIRLLDASADDRARAPRESKAGRHENDAKKRGSKNDKTSKKARRS